jgi:ribosomal protein S30
MTSKAKAKLSPEEREAKKYARRQQTITKFAQQRAEDSPQLW